MLEVANNNDWETRIFSFDSRIGVFQHLSPTRVICTNQKRSLEFARQ